MVNPILPQYPNEENRQGMGQNLEKRNENSEPQIRLTILECMEPQGVIAWGIFPQLDEAKENS
jgi:hypothetical protein